MDWNPKDIIEIALASSVPIVLLGVLANRLFVSHESPKGTKLRGKGVGWQTIRFSVLTTGLPIVALLAIRGIVSGEAAIAFIAASAGYAFGHAGSENSQPGKSPQKAAGDQTAATGR